MRESANTNKERIQAIALELFREKGYDEVTISDICKAAGCSNSTFYYQFGTKENLLREYLDRFSFINQNTLPRLIAIESAWEKLWLIHQEFIDSIMSLGPELYRKMRMLLSANGYNQDDQTALNSYKSLLSPLIAQGQQRGEILNHTDASSLASTVALLVIGIATDWCVNQSGQNLKQVMRTHLENLYDLRTDLRIHSLS